jgi:hypothetical protein
MDRTMEHSEGMISERMFKAQRVIISDRGVKSLVSNIYKYEYIYIYMLK